MGTTAWWRIGFLATLGLLGVLVVLAKAPGEVSQAELDRIEARISDARLAGVEVPAVIPVTQAGVNRCLRGAGFVVRGTKDGHGTVRVRGRGLPETWLRVVGEGVPAPTSTGGRRWNATAQALFDMPPFHDAVVRRAFFDCVDPHEPLR